MNHHRKYHLFRWRLGDGFKYFWCSHRNMEKWSDLTSIFFRWVGSTTNWNSCYFFQASDKQIIANQRILRTRQHGRGDRRVKLQVGSLIHIVWVHEQQYQFWTQSSASLAVFKRCPDKAGGAAHTHQQLEGSAPGHGSRTKLAQVYPYRFCSQLIRSLLPYGIHSSHGMMASSCFKACPGGCQNQRSPFDSVASTTATGFLNRMRGRTAILWWMQTTEGLRRG